jgi:hypothetical protein
VPALTLREVLALDPVRAAGPELLAGESALDRPVRWVHSSEVYEVYEVYEGAYFLDGGELPLTNSFGLTDADAEVRRRYVRELAARDAAGLAVEVGRSLPNMPPEVIDEARRVGLPLLEWEAAHASDLVRTLEVHLRNGCSPTRTAALLHIGRQSLYQRLERIESLLGLEIGDPDLLGELLAAACAHRVVRGMRPAVGGWVADGGLRVWFSAG